MPRNLGGHSIVMCNANKMNLRLISLDGDDIYAFDERKSSIVVYHYGTNTWSGRLSGFSSYGEFRHQRIKLMSEAEKLEQDYSYLKRILTTHKSHVSSEKAKLSRVIDDLRRVKEQLSQYNVPWEAELTDYQFRAFTAVVQRVEAAKITQDLRKDGVIIPNFEYRHTGGLRLKSTQADVSLEEWLNDIQLQPGK